MTATSSAARPVRRAIEAMSAQAAREVGQHPRLQVGRRADHPLALAFLGTLAGA